MARRSRSRCRGCALLSFPQPFLSLAQAPPEVAGKVRGYLAGLAFALPPALLFTAYRGFNIAVSRPKAVMALQLGALLLKVPLSALLVFGASCRRRSASCACRPSAPPAAASRPRS